MPFNTYTFIVFFAVVFFTYHLVPLWNVKKKILLIASYVFYSAWNPLFIFLLMFSTVTDWILAKKIYQSKQRPFKKGLLLLSLLCNLGLLFYFKYWNLLVETSIFMLSKLGIIFSPQPLDIVLPVGISFYTFQTLSYTIDVYRGKIDPAKNFSDYALYVSFFPQLVAGPIVRASDFLPQCHNKPHISLNNLGWGFSLITVGLFMKTVLADVVFGPVVNNVFANSGQFSSMDTWIAVFSFSGQIFCDFSGYSTIAIGTAMCLGFTLPDNFRSPYAALGMRDFWRRWHISLSSWLRDYLYISMGGNRRGPIRTYINIMLTMLIGGLWHGASWMFVLWGGLHGFYLVVEHSFSNLLTKINIPSRISVLAEKYLQIFWIGITFIIVSITWIFFRSESINQAKQILLSLIGVSSETIAHKLQLHDLLVAGIFIALMLGWQFYNRNSFIEYFFANIHFITRALILSLMLLSIYLFSSGDNNAFIYFQF